MPREESCVSGPRKVAQCGRGPQGKELVQVREGREKCRNLMGGGGRAINSCSKSTC